MRWLALASALFLLPARAQETTETRELIGQLGKRSTLLALYATRRADGSWRVTGEYLILATMQRRYLEGERSAQLGVTFFKEGTTPILWSRAPTATLQGTWRDGKLRGTRYGPAGQIREQFEFSEEFPSMEDYSAQLGCELADGRYESSFALALDSGRARPGSLQWRSKVAPSGHACALGALEQRPFHGGIRLAAGRCAVILRDLGDYVKVDAEDCQEYCASQGYFEPLLLDKSGGRCQPLRGQPR
jgi:hypothetical protein